jgi:ribosomal protein S18 acetylase RimI-like enzyme
MADVTISRDASADVWSSSAGLTIRPFAECDYGRQAAIGAAINPGLDRGLAWYRHCDQSWDPSLRRLQLVAERDHLVVGWGEVGHMWWAYHPRRFVLRLNVDPAYQQRGIGSRLYAALMDSLASWSPLFVGAETRATRPDSVGFLKRRGFVEHHRRWAACLVLSEARVERFAGAYERVAQQGIEIVTFAEERARRGEQLLRDLFDLEVSAQRDEPGFDLGVLSFERFVANELETGDLLDDGSVLALAKQQLVGVCRLGRYSSSPSHLHIGFTGVHPEYRRRGIASALKLRTVEYGQAHGFDEIRTENDTTNATMLHINAALGFQLEPPWIILEKEMATRPSLPLRP